MGLGYDLDQFLDHCRMTKPPYECPHVSCVKIYKSFVGIQHHMTTYDHENPPPNVVTPKSARKKNLKRLPSPVPSAEPDVPSIPHSHDMKMVVFEIDGKTTELSVYDPIEILSKEEYEASMPPPVEEPPPQEQARTPSAKPQPKTPTQKTPKNRGNDKDRGLDVQKYTIEEKKTNKLPEANYRIITNYYPELPDAPPRPTNYFRYIEKTVEELDEEVEYDMDEEDRVWLEVMNEKREVDGLDVVDMETFEFLMDRLEKESFFQAQSSGKEPGVPIDEDAVCCICMDGECQNSNVILFCDMCNLAVHQECYGVPYIPEGQWLCRRCLQSPSRAVDCALCPNKGGAFKQTDDGRWAHVVCAMWIPEVCFANTVFLEPIDSIGNIPPARWKLGCYICKQRGLGACIQCNKINCYTAFHVTCAQQAGLHMKMDAVSETNANGTSVTVRKAAYCDVHTPADSDARPQVDEIMDSAKKAAAKAASRQKMRKARKILAEKRSAAPIVSVPTIPADKIQKLASTVSMQKKSQFMHRLLAFWTLKRQSRNGVPLLRRLTTSHSRRNNRAAAAAAAALVELDHKKEDKRVLSEAERLREEIKYWQRLRQDLERARLLCELIRKREKTKRELVKVKAEEKIIQLAPFVHLLLQTIDLIQDKDIHMIFAEPVDFDEVQDYLDVVKHPMDLSTMRQKAQAHQYRNVDDFASDFNLMIENCLKYNSKDTIFYRAGIKLRDQGGAIIRQLRRNVADVGFDMETGLLLPHRPKPLQEVSDNKIIREVDNALALDVDESMSLEDREKQLLELLDKANLLRHHVARIKRVKLIRREITILRRKIAMNQSGSTCGRKVPVTYDTEDESDKEDSDPDDSSVIDDEAEPGERRPSPPPPPISLYPPIGSGLPSTPRRTLSFQGSTPTSARGAKRGRTSTPLGSSKIDPKQKRIDLYFPRVGRGQQHSSSSTPSSPMPPTEESHVPKISSEAKVPSNKEKEDSPSIQQEQPKRRGPGRPPKRSRTVSCPSNSPPAKKLEAELCEPTSPVKSSECGEGEDPPSVPSSPSGVNRRTSVLFTKKKPENPSPQKRVGRPRKNSESGSPGSGRPVTALPATSSGPTFGAEACAGGPSDIKGKGGRKKKSGLKGGEVSLSGSSMTFPEGITILDLTDENLPPPKESFKIYRQGGEIPPETDEDTHSESNSSMTDTEEETASESESEGGESGESDDESSCGGGENSGQTGSDGIPLEPLDLVWAKCRGYPWYPALIINPKMPKTGYFHNGVPIPVPPNEVLALASNYELPIYLILFFDNKRTWQWLPRNKLEPLGVDSTLDKAKLVESRKPAERKAVKRAYEKAILHRCRVTGENTGLSGESDNEDHT